jgi:hypothetical protein
VLGVVLTLALAAPGGGRTSFATYREEVLADAPASYWRLDEASGPAAADEKAVNPGTYTAGVTLGRPGPLTTEPDTAAAFDGVDDSMLVPDSSSLDMTSAVTLELWLRRNAVSARFETIAGKPGDGRSRLENYSIWLNPSDQLQAYWGNGRSYVTVVTAPVRDRRWHHVAATHDGSSIRIYLDGALQQTKAVTLALTANAGPFTVGRAVTDGTLFNGDVDEVAVYPSALSAERIAARFAKGDVAAPGITLTAPGGGTSSGDLTPTFAGVGSTAAGDSPTVVVNVWAGTSTSGTPARTLVAGVQPDGSYSVEATPFAEGQWTARAEQVDVRGNVGESAAVTFRLDATPPVVTITSKPSNPSSSTSPVFAFSANETSTFECRLDGGAPAACTSPKSYSGLAEGGHTFEVAGRDGAGNTSAPVQHAWTIDTTPPPAPAIDSGPPAFTSATSATFTFSDAEPGATFECRRDGAAFAACTSPHAYAGLGDGAHAFDVRARDAAGNTSAATSRAWTIDATAPPVPTIDSGPPPATSATGASFAFTDGEAGVSFECRLDGAAFSACTSPRTYAGLADGAHTFEVRALDAAGNASAAASRGWTIDATPPPPPAIDSGPSGATSATDASFAFSDAEAGVTLECRSDGGAFAPCTSPYGLSGLADGVHTFSVRALDAAGNASAATSRGWTVDTVPPPAPDVESGPPDLTTATTASFEFSSLESGVAFECRLDGAAFAGCTSPQGYGGLADGAHVFEVRARDAAGNAGAPAARAWTIDSTPPPVPAIDSGPPASTNETTATFAFSGTEPGVAFECRRDAGAFAACTSPRAYGGLADGPHTFEVRARDAAGNASAAASHGWTVDATPPPVPTIDSGPPAATAETSATFGFSDAEPGVAFECRLDGAAFAGCTAPQTYAPVVDGPHTFEVRARDAAGNVSPAASRSWTVDSTPPPVPTIDSGPPAVTAATSATFAFSDGEAGVDFECRVDGGSFAPCTSPEAFSGLGDGSHTFEVRALDAAGNASAAASRAWTVDATPPPAPSIDSGPATTTAATDATFAFSDGEAGATFECRLDGAVFAACTSPHTVSGLANGAHTFDVRARDAAGNASAVASHGWTVDLSPPPAPTIDSGPAAVTSSSSATLAFSDPEPGVTFECRLDAAPFAACTSPQVFSGLAEGGHGFDVRARDAAGNASAATGHAWTIDTTPPPAPTIDSGPAAQTAATSATFAFSSTEGGVSFECRLDAAAFEPCTSPATFTGLADGSHTFEVRAADAAGNVGAVASRAWTVDATAPPPPTIGSGPATPTNATAATLTFSDAEAGVSFECRLDAAGFAPCTSPADYASLGEGPHTFDVRARDAAGNTSAAASHGWTVDTTAPSVSLTAPADGSVVADATPELSGTAGLAAGDAALVAVELWAGPAPSGPPATTLSAGRQPDGSFAVEPGAPLAEGQWTARATQGDAAGNAGLSQTVTFTIALTVPTVTIVSAPADPTTSTAASFEFTASEPATFECSLDGAAFAACTNPQAYTGLALGAHAFAVRARSTAGTLGPAASHSWTVQVARPDPPTIVSGPANPTILTSAGFTFTHPSPDVTFECRLDGAAYEPCTSPEGYGQLAFGAHLFEVRALDAATGSASDPAAYPWTIIAPPPLPTVDSGPSNPTTSTSATFTFSDSEPGVTFDCTLDGSPPTACTSPKTYTGVANGAHTFTVKAVNAQGGRSDQVPYRWTVDTEAPAAPQLESGPSGTTPSTSATFTFADAGTPATPSLGASLPARLPSSAGATVYVATTGSDGAPGTQDQPWRTVQKALDTLQPGQRALVGGGTYTEDLRFTRSGTASDPITVAAAPGEVVVLHAASTTPDTYPLRITGSYLRVQGFVIENALGASSANVFLFDGAHHVELRGNEIRFSQDQGVYAERTTSDLHILGNRIHDNGLGHVEGQHQSHGIYLEGANDLVANNVIWRQPFGFGIQLFPQNTGSIVVGNTVVANGQSGILVGGEDGVGDITIRNNVVAHNRLYGIDHDSTCPTGPVRVDHNVIWGNRNGAVHGSCPATIDVSGGNTLAQPSFVNEDGPDYRLLPGSGSPGIDAALAEYALPDDVDGVSRPRGPAADMGAHENGVAFQCRLDGSPFAPCTSAQTYTGLAGGGHTFEVRAVDGAGNASAPVSRDWTVDTQPPAAPSITAGPAGTTAATAAAFEFAGEPGTTLECSLDGAPFAACTSPQAYTGLADGTHTFEVRAVDGAGRASAPAARTWTVDTAPPAVPAITSGPSGATSSSSASFAFTGEPGAALECRLDAAAFAGCTSPQAYTGLAEGDHTFEVRALDAAGNASATATRTWTVDATPPATPAITAGPTGTTGATAATLEFAGEPGVTFECRLDGAPFAACTSPQTYTGLGDGAHLFELRALDAAGNASAPASRSWTVDGRAPTTTITNGPASPTALPTATLAFTADEPATFECRLDGGAYAPCTSPTQYTGLADGAHAVDVRATDPSGNTGPPASHGWTVDSTPPPAPAIVSGPADPTTATGASFAFTDGEAGVAFECRLDGGAFAACTSPSSYAGLAPGAHTFAVRAVDAAGNASAATTFPWTISPPSSGPPSVRSVSSNALNLAASLSIPLPAGTVPGDLLLAVVGHQGGTARSMTPPSGWTAVPNADYAQGTNARIHAWYRFAGPDEPASYTFTLTGGSAQDSAGGILAIAGARAPGPIDASLGQVNGTNSTAVTAPALAPSLANALLVFGGSANGAVTFTPPAGMTEQLDRATTGTYKVATSVATQALAVAGPTGTRIATISSAVKSAAIAIAIAPA